MLPPCWRVNVTRLNWCAKIWHKHTDKRTHIFTLLAWSYSLVRGIDTQHRCSPELFHSRGFIPGQNPRRCRAASVSSELMCLPWTRAAQLDKKQYRTHYIYYLQWMRTVKWSPGIFLTYRCTPSTRAVSDMKDKLIFPIITSDVTQCCQSQAVAAL